MSLRVWFLVLSVLVLPAAPRADQPAYDPTSCSTDAGGEFFVRLDSGLVLSFPPGDVAGHRLHDQGDGEPAGCPLNPLVVREVPVRYRPVLPSSPGEPAERWQPFFIQVGGQEWGALGGYFEHRHFREWCLDSPDAPPLIEHPPALVECRFSDRDGRPTTSLIVAKPGAHPWSGVRPFIMECDPHYIFPPLPEGVRMCSTSYRPELGLTIGYEVLDIEVPPEHIAAFDLQIRAFVAARRRPDLDFWP
jgi:hypothetical protein